MLEEVLGLGVDIELAALRVLGEVEGRNLGDVLILALTLLFLELEGDTTDGTTLDTLHQVSGVAGNLREILSVGCHGSASEKEVALPCCAGASRQ